MHIARIAQGLPAISPPRDTALGSLVNYLTRADVKSFQPANITFDLLPQLDEATRKRVRDKKVRHKMVCDQALKASAEWLELYSSPTSVSPAVMP
jgi:methylenetetrahydrofolate--tRNA-(uracil-5-)-methyltransferase